MKKLCKSAMRCKEKQLLELAVIELGYAQLEVQFADQTTEALNRIGHHLSELEKRLAELACLIKGVNKNGDEQVGKEKRNA